MFTNNTNNNSINNNGIITIQIFVINSSYFNLTKLDLNIATILRKNNNKEGIKLKKIINNNKEDITLTYSVHKIKLKYIQPYSVINPAINSDSASVKSKGTLFVSIIKTIKVKINKRKLKLKNTIGIIVNNELS